MNRGLIVSLRSDTDELIFSESSSLRIMAGGLSGFDYPETSVDLVADVGGKISYARSSMIGAREMSIRFEVTRREEFRAIRDCVNRMMMPGRSLALSTCYLGRRRTAEVLPFKAPEYIFESLADTVQIILHLTAPRPYFTEGVVYRSSVPAARAVMTFPVNFIKSVGAITSFAGAKNAAVIHNPGDTDCPVTMYLYAEGTVREPYIMLGERRIRLLGELAAGDKVKIESGDGRHTVTVNGAVRNDLDRRSRFFSLSPGDNTVVLNAAYGASTLRGAFEFEPRYLGI